MQPSGLHQRRHPPSCLTFVNHTPRAFETGDQNRTRPVVPQTLQLSPTSHSLALPFRYLEHQPDDMYGYGQAHLRHDSTQLSATIREVYDMGSAFNSFGSTSPRADASAPGAVPSISNGSGDHQLDSGLGPLDQRNNSLLGPLNPTATGLPDPGAWSPPALLSRRHSWTSTAIAPEEGALDRSFVAANLSLINLAPNPNDDIVFEDEHDRLRKMRAPPIPPHSQLQEQLTFGGTLLPVTNPSFDIAYFLKHTGPPSPARTSGAGNGTSRPYREKRKMRGHGRSPLRFWKVGRRKSLATRTGTVERQVKA